ncbi:AAA family ATPase [Streptomyces griseorubiginosus]|uniref:AAA family ATPase n=1 Tax=Streptomyces griseorubiginosus TaxID=67304 RepID=UPI0036E828CE
MSEYEEIIAGLEAHGSRRSGTSGWQCLAHDDRVASLSVTERNGKPLVYCQAGCDTNDVLAAIGTSWEKLRPQNEPGKTSWVAKYEYTDERGGVLFVKERGEPKTFRVYKPLTGGRRQYRDVFGGSHPARRVLYRLPAVVKAITEGCPVYLVEGEKDVASAERAGVTATCNYEGAAKSDQRPKWRPEYGDMLKGAHVVIVADNDDAGRAHAAAAYNDLRRKAASVRVVRGLVDKDKADLTDHLAAGHSIDDLVSLDAPAPVDDRDDFSELLMPEKDEEEPGRLDPETMSSEEYFAARVKAMLGEFLDTDDLDKIAPLEPLLGDLLQVNTLCRAVGPSGSFKSFVLLDMCGCIGTGTKWHGQYVKQGTVVYLVAEGEQGIRKRVRAWEQQYGMRMDNVRFLPRPVQAMSPEWDVLIAALQEIGPVLVVVDTQARVTVGIEENSNKEMGQVVDRVDQLRTATGACVVLVHHTGHVGEHGRGASAVKGALQSELNVSRKGDKLSNIVLTVKSGKQKDEDQSDEFQFGLKKLAIDGEFKPDGRPVTSLVLESLDSVPDRGPEPGTAEWIVRELDKAQVPYGWGRDRVSAKCKELGIQARKEKIEEAVRIRKARGKDLPPDLPPTDQPLPAPDGGAGSDETPDQTCPGQVGGRSGQGAENLPAPASSLGRGQVVHEGPKCAGCHGKLDAFFASHGHDRHPGC